MQQNQKTPLLKPTSSSSPWCSWCCLWNNHQSSIPSINTSATHHQSSSLQVSNNRKPGGEPSSTPSSYVPTAIVPITSQTLSIPTSQKKKKDEASSTAATPQSTVQLSVGREGSSLPTNPMP